MFYFTSLLGDITALGYSEDYDYYEQYFAGTQSILAENNWHKSGNNIEEPCQLLTKYEHAKLCSWLTYCIWIMATVIWELASVGGGLISLFITTVSNLVQKWEKNVDKRFSFLEEI